jgi:predicted metal-dependent HD superfamily phosphohydrolase
MILATKKHVRTGDSDTDHFTDADLAILGAAPQTYYQYTRQIRKEYVLYPDFLYNQGRKKVLQHFLEMPDIFKTSHFKGLYEKNARKNIAEEIISLSR